jgi:acyl carrier protein
MFVKKVINFKQQLNMEEFLKNFAAQFEETDSNEFLPETEFKKLEEWNSMVALSIIAMADEQYQYKLRGDDIRSSQTIKDLFDIIKSK